MNGMWQDAEPGVPISRDARAAETRRSKEQHHMKFVVIGEPSGASMEALMKVFPRHKELVDRLIQRGVVIGIGPFSDRGNLAIFKTRAAAEEFVRDDPFALEGLVKSYRIKEWDDSLIPE